MDNAAINAKLYAKMEESFQDFSSWLLKQHMVILEGDIPFLLKVCLYCHHILKMMMKILFF